MLVQSIRFKPTDSKEFPYHLPFFREDPFLFTQPVTFLIGDNGAGKSTFIELVQDKLQLHRIAMGTAIQNELQNSLHRGSRSVDVTYVLTKPRGFCFGAEDFTSYIHSVAQEIRDSKAEIERVQHEYQGRSDFAKVQAASPFQRTIHELQTLYQRDLLTASHGEAYLEFFASRIHNNELYLLDEPETPLSIHNQLTLIALIHQGVLRGCQFIIATHSPVLLAYPNAQRIHLSSKGCHELAYQEVESVMLLKQFLNQPEAFLHHLLKE